ncbi:uroplakin-3b-like [Aquarana catesbeiana]|uniref:uroplakin-3b-like n=1 Tax=Aquarana catesbeiana TaxID=8400 RepID=UPI003CC9A57D
MRSCAPVMRSLAILLFICVTSLNAQPNAPPLSINCPPVLVGSSLLGRLTSSGFALQDFCCAAAVSGINPTDNVVVVVALANAVAKIDLSGISISNPPLYLNLPSNGFYAPITATVGGLCNGPAFPFGAVLIGDSFYCLQTGNQAFCNGPLFPGLSYRVALLIYRNGQLSRITPWSDVITLTNPQDFHTIDPNPRSRSASMIVISTILPLLVLALLAIFVLVLFLRCCCKRFAPKRCQQGCE